MKKTTIIAIILIVSLIIVISIGYFKHNNRKIIKEKNEEKYVFFEKGKTKSKTNIYHIVKDEYEKIGEIESDISLKFSKLDKEYLLIDGFDKEYYIRIQDIIEDNELVIENIDNRYKEYIPFNENIITKAETSFYDEYDNLLYKIDTTYEFPIIIKDDNRYGIEFNNRLLYIHEDNIEKIIEVKNSNKTNTSGVGVLNYHFFYDSDIVEERKDCNQIICKSIKDFQKELDYLKENNIMTLMAHELEWYIDSKINLPKSVLITIDDGWRMNQGIELLEKNKMYGTVFLITSWWDNINFLNVYNYVEFHSHGDDLHDVGVCPGGQGGAIKCLERNKLIEDLNTSSDKLNGSKYIAYPFYEYNNYSIEILKEVNFRMAFVGYNYSNNYARVGSNKYTIPRYVMYDYTTINDIDSYLNKIK